MQVGVQQIDAVEGDLDVVAQIRVDPDDVAPGADLRWRRGRDDLDAFSYVALRGPERAAAMLIAYENDPEANVLVLMEPSEGVQERLASLLRVLELPSGTRIERDTPPEDAEPTQPLRADVEQMRERLDAVITLLQSAMPAAVLASQGFPVVGELQAALPNSPDADELENVISLNVRSAQRARARARGAAGAD